MIEPGSPGGPYRRLAALASHPALAGVPTPTLVVVPELVDANIAHLVELLGSTSRARPHVKTARIGWTITRLREAGIDKVKAATPAEVAVALSAGMSDVLLAYPAVGPVLDAMGALARAHPDRRVSVLVDRPEVARDWPARELAAFLDLDTGLGRTGVPAGDRDRVCAVLDALRGAGIRCAGVHAYDGHLAGPDHPAQHRRVAEALAPVLALAHDVGPAELVVGGSHTFLPAVATCDDAGLAEIVTGSPGTVVYGDHRSISRFGGSNRFTPAAAVLSRVVSASTPGSVTVDAGLTAIQTDAGRPHFVVAGQSSWTAGEAAQEHVAIHCAESPPVGAVLPLVPFHIDTALAQFSSVLVLTDDGSVREPVLPRHGR